MHVEPPLSLSTQSLFLLGVPSWLWSQTQWCTKFILWQIAHAMDLAAHSISRGWPMAGPMSSLVRPHIPNLTFAGQTEYMAGMNPLKFITSI